MKPFRLVFCFIALGIVTGCASTDVTEQESRMGEEAIAKPETIYVYPFAASLADVPSWSAAAIRYATPSELQSAEERAAGRELGALVAKELVAEIEDLGLAAAMASEPTNPKVNDLMIIGYFEAVEEGSGAKRFLLGFGSGKAELSTAVEGYQMTTLGPRLLGSGSVESSGKKTPGAIVPLAVLAATANPIGLVVTSTAKVVGEATGRDKIEGAAKRTAEEIAERLEEKFEEQGWIR
jgi:hypothetical protein